MQRATTSTTAAQPARIPLTPTAAGAIVTALNRADRHDLAKSIGWPGEAPSLARADTETVLEALGEHRDVLVDCVGRATLYDPNDENVWLDWTETAIAELRAGVRA